MGRRRKNKSKAKAKPAPAPAPAPAPQAAPETVPEAAAKPAQPPASAPTAAEKATKRAVAAKIATGAAARQRSGSLEMRADLFRKWKGMAFGAQPVGPGDDRADGKGGGRRPAGADPEDEADFEVIGDAEAAEARRATRGRRGSVDRAQRNFFTKWKAAVHRPPGKRRGSVEAAAALFRRRKSVDKASGSPGRSKRRKSGPTEEDEDDEPPALEQAEPEPEPEDETPAPATAAATATATAAWMQAHPDETAAAVVRPKRERRASQTSIDWGNPAAAAAMAAAAAAPPQPEAGAGAEPEPESFSEDDDELPPLESADGVQWAVREGIAVDLQNPHLLRLTKVLMVIVHLHKTGKISTAQKYVLKNSALLDGAGDDSRADMGPLFAAVEVFEVDGDLGEMEDTFQKAAKLLQGQSN